MDQKGECIRKCFVNHKRLIKCKGLLLLQWEMQKASKVDLVAVSTGVTFCFLKEKKQKKKIRTPPSPSSSKYCQVHNVVFPTLRSK